MRQLMLITVTLSNYQLSSQTSMSRIPNYYCTKPQFIR